MSVSERLKKFDIYINEEQETQPDTPELAALCSELNKALSKKIAAIPIWFNYTQEEQKELILNFLNTKLNEQFSEIKLTASEKERISREFFESIYGFGSLDFLIAQKEISKIFVNSPTDIYTEVLGCIEKADVTIDRRQFESLINNLTELSGKNSSVITFRFNNLLVTILKEPVCSEKLILKKVADTNFDFSFFERRDILTEDISKFLRTLLNSKKRILISSPVQCGKTAFLNSFINEIPNPARIMLFEEGALINTKNNSITRFDVEGLSEKERRDLITAALYYKPEFIFSDINNIGFNIEITDLAVENFGFVSTVRANSITEAVSFYTSVLVSRLKCTEKLAKIQLAKDIDYIIQLQKNDEYFNISSIVEVNANKAGTPVLNEVLTFKSGEYKYRLETSEKQKPADPAPEIKPEEETTKPKNFSFSARFNY